MGGVLARPLSLASAAGKASTSSAAARSIVTPITTPHHRRLRENLAYATIPPGLAVTGFAAVARLHLAHVKEKVDLPQRSRLHAWR